MLTSELFEARNSALTYTEKKVKDKIDRLTVTLSGSESGSMTKLTKQYKSMQVRLERVTALKEELNSKIKGKILDLYDAEDEIYTRVVETVSLTATLAKKGTEGTKVDYEKVVKGLEALMPELKEKLDELIKEYTSVVKAKEPGLTVKVSEDLSDVWKSMKAGFKSLLKSFKDWGKSYDKKLAEVKAMI